MSYIGMPIRALVGRWLLVAALTTSIGAGSSGVGKAYASDDGRDGPASVAFQSQESEDSDPEAALPSLFAVFMVTWAVFFGYVFYTSRRQREMRREIDTLRMAMSEMEQRSGKAEQKPTGSQETD